jgi:FG-GAP-like repeat
MSKKKRRNLEKRLSKKTSFESSDLQPSNQTNWLAYLKTHWQAIAIIVFLSIGAFGAGLKYLEEDAKREMIHRANNKGKINDVEEASLLLKINPFVPAPLPNPTPQIAKEYIYAGSKLLAVEDANANATPPADLAIWRPSSGQWWILNGQNSQYYSVSWGTNNDVPVPGDFDGDGKTDFSIFRPSTNTWWVMKSSDYSYYSVTFGASGDIPASADYDGDGKTDVAVYRAGTWYINQSSNNTTIYPQFGLSTDKPAPKDYDSDGKADLAVWRNSNTTFYSQNSSNTVLQTATFSQSSTNPVSADYDGDGRADYAIRNGSDWIIRQSSNNQTNTIIWQQASDTEVQNDYDGDGKVDIAVWRNSNGNWYIRQSSLNGQLRQVAWGTSGDIPVPTFYRW